MIKLSSEQRAELGELTSIIAGFQDGLATIDACCASIIRVLMEIKDTGDISDETMKSAMQAMAALRLFDIAKGTTALDRCGRFLQEALR